jgi:hypothetical protein
MSPDQLTEGVHKLSVNVIFSSGTGSLADKMGLEGYMGEISWNIHVIRDPQKYFVVGYRINDEGFLEISWKNVLPENLLYSLSSNNTAVSSKFSWGYVFIENEAF